MSKTTHLKMHMRDAPDKDDDLLWVSLCGMIAPRRHTSTEAAVTCLVCVRELRKRPKPFERGPASPVVLGTRHAADVRLPPRVRRERPRWRSVEAAIAEWLSVRFDGYTMPNVADPRRMETLASGAGTRSSGARVDRATELADDLVAVDVAIARCVDDIHLRELTATEVRRAVVERTVGRRVGSRVIGPFEVARIAGDLAEERPATKREGVTAKAVGAVSGLAIGRIRHHLQERGLVPGRKRDMSSAARSADGTPQAQVYDLRGWGDIATELGVAESTARSYQAYTPPIPVKRIGNRIRASSVAIRAWVELNAKRR